MLRGFWERTWEFIGRTVLPFVGDVVALGLSIRILLTIIKPLLLKYAPLMQALSEKVTFEVAITFSLVVVGALYLWFRQRWDDIGSNFIVRLVKISLVAIYGSFVVASLLREEAEFHQFDWDLVTHYGAAACIALIAYYLRRDIYYQFERLVERELHIRLPMLLASSPILVGFDTAAWQRHSLRPAFDWTYAGVSALQGLINPKSRSHQRTSLAVVSDFSICLEIGRRSPNEAGDLYVLPFAKVTNSLAVISYIADTTGSDSPGSGDSVAGGTRCDRKIDFYEGSIQEEYLLRCPSSSGFQRGEGRTNMLGAMVRSIKRQSQGFVLWEPYYAIFDSNLNATGLLTEAFKVEHCKDHLGGDFVWVLCLVAHKSDLDHHGNLSRDILSAMREACSVASANITLLQQVIRQYLPEEIAGLSEAQISAVLAEKNHEFDIAIACKTLFEGGDAKFLSISQDQLLNLGASKIGADRLMMRWNKGNYDAIWPGLGNYMRGR